MVKNKRQKDPEEEDSTPSSDEKKQQKAVSCCHVGKSVNLNAVRKSLGKAVAFDECQQCDNGKEEKDEGEPDVEQMFWMCLRCGHRGCDRNSKCKHALAHAQAVRSDPHTLAVNTSVWSVWCYSCDNQINVTTSKKLQECVEYIRKQAGLPSRKTETPMNGMTGDGSSESMTSTPSPDLKSNEKGEVSTEKEVKNAKNMQSALEGSLPKVKGLGNLGNTCFLNAVLQALSQTHYLAQILDTHWQRGQTLHLPGVFSTEGESLPPLDVVLPEGGPLTSSLAYLLKDMMALGHNRSVHVGQLYAQISRKSPQFRGFQQQDSHELLRHLLDGIKTEEIKRYKTGILRSFNLSEKVNPNTVDEEDKRKIKAYGLQAVQTLVDSIFGGHLVSTVVCKECQVASQVLEPFMDLSLSMMEEKSPPRNQRRMVGKDNSVTHMSKYEMKKVRQQARKGNKQGRRHQGRQKKTLENSHVSHVVDSNRQMEECNGEENGKKVDSDVDISDVIDADVEDNEETDLFTQVSRKSTLAPDEVSTEVAFTEQDANALDCKLNELHITPTKVQEEEEDDSNEFVVSSCVNGHLEKSAEGDGEVVFRSEQEEWTIQSQQTLAPRYQVTHGECSVMSCLNQLTMAELLTGSNKFGCENCTKKLGCRKENKMAMVHTISSKQMLIFSPPAILTLHLKRFQQISTGLRKVNRHVAFPLALDLAPFCSCVCVGLPTMKSCQKKILYSLYAVVEHSGTLSGGHYTAYVKARLIDPNKQFLNTQPMPHCRDSKGLAREMIEKARRERSEEVKEAEQAEGSESREEKNSKEVARWYHVSDSVVREVNEDKVLRSQAYLLFYERIC